jgi:hypothetical protein
METSFELLPLGNRNITTLRTVWENSDYTEVTAPAPLARSFSPLWGGQFRQGGQTSTVRTFQISILADFILKKGRKARIAGFGGRPALQNAWIRNLIRQHPAGLNSGIPRRFYAFAFSISTRQE